MKYEVAMDWAAALRSGKYKQGKSYLRTGENEFCCLGVLCDISEQGNWSNEQFYHRYVFGDQKAENVLPSVVIKWAGIQGGSGVRYIDFENDEEHSLWTLNDILEYSFEEIADVIEEHWEIL
jgi:hypothetical protein